MKSLPLPISAERHGYLTIVAPMVLLFAICHSISGCQQEAEGPILSGGRELESWISALENSNPQIRRQAVLKLGNAVGEDDSIEPALLKALQDSDALVRRDAIFAVAKLKPPGKEVLEQLTSMSHTDSDPDVRDIASRALKNVH